MRFNMVVKVSKIGLSKIQVRRLLLLAAGRKFDLVAVCSCERLYKKHTKACFVM
jgi:hypothetical protein